jgi:CHAD domain-containing protein
MAIDQQQRRRIFQYLDRLLGKMSKGAEAEDVHRFRTYSRRVETFLENLGLEQTGNDKKLARLLKRLRKKAGKVRDLDVQITSLEGLKISSQQRHKDQMLRVMRKERDSRASKLEKSFDHDTVTELRRRLRRTSAEAIIPEDVSPLAIAKQMLVGLENDRAPISEKRMHQYRLAGKRARYIAEFAGENAEAALLIKAAKRMQDVIGDWHDWLELTNRAEDLFGRAHDSSLVSVLQNLTRAKFRQAIHALAETTQTIRNLPAPSPEEKTTVRKALAAESVNKVSAVA